MESVLNHNTQNEFFGRLKAYMAANSIQELLLGLLHVKRSFTITVAL